MPLFTYICENGHTHDAIAENGVQPRPCSECGWPAARLFKMPQVISMKPYVTTAGDGVPTEIRTSGEERAYEKKHGIAHLTNIDLKQMRSGLRGQKARIRKARQNVMEPMAESYAKAEARLARMGKEHLKEEANKERHEMATAIE